MQKGDKVVYIGGAHLRLELKPFDYLHYKILGTAPIINSVYVIRGFWVSPEGGLGLILIGSSCIHISTNTEVGWHSGMFRRLEEIQAKNKNLKTETQTA